MAKNILPGEPNPNSPKNAKKRGKGAPIPGGKPKMPLPTEPSPAGRYKALKNSFQTPGMQPGEKEAIAAIMKNRGVSRAEARAIGKRRTSKGLTTAGVSGPGGNPKYNGQPGRKNVKNPGPLPDPGYKKPGTPVNGPAPQPGDGPTPGMTSSRRSPRSMPKRPTRGSK